MEDRIVPASPVAFSDGTYSVVHGQILYVPADGVLANDTDADNDTLTAIQVSYPSHGYGVVSSAGSVSYYSTSPGYVGLDSFTYKANDGTNDSNTVTVTINVTNAAPVGTNATEVVNENDSLMLDVDDLFTDADGDTLTAVVDTDPTRGRVAIDGSAITYTPFRDYNGTDSFIISVSDGYGGTDTAMVSVTVRPLVYFESYEFFADQGDTATITVCLTGLSAEDVVVHYATSNGTAESGEDYTGASSTVTIEAGYDSATFTISILTDENADDLENFTITLSEPENAGLGTPAVTNFVIATALDEEEDPIPRLNELSVEIQTILGEITTLRTGANGVNARLAEMNTFGEAMYADLYGAEPSLQDFRDDFVEYNNIRTGTDKLQGVLDDVLEKADEILSRASEAAEKSQGEKFRILGIGVALDALNKQLGMISDALEGQRTNLALLDVANYEGLTPQQVGDVEIARLALLWQKGRLAARAIAGVAVYSLHINDTPPGGAIGAAIDALNANFNYLKDMETYVIGMHTWVVTYDSQMYAAEDWGTYNTAQHNFRLRIDDNIFAIAADRDPEIYGLSAFDKAREAKPVVDDAEDSFAMAGLRELVRRLTAYLEAEQALVEDQITYMEAFVDSDEKEVAIFNLNALWDRLDTALTRMASF